MRSAFAAHVPANSGAGAPVDVAFRSHLTPERLRAALSSVSVASMTLHNCPMQPPHVPPDLVAALAESAATLTALHGLPTAELQGNSHLGLAAFPRLRALTLRQTPDSPRVLPAALLPLSLEDFTLTYSDPPNYGHHKRPMRLVDLDALPQLRRITLAAHTFWPLGTWFYEGDPPQRLRLPASLQVWLVHAVIEVFLVGCTGHAC